MKVGDRVRIAAGSEVVGYCSGDKGTVVSVISDDLLYDVAMDKDGPKVTTFTPDKLEPDA
jgi:hypothetical protein